MIKEAKIASWVGQVLVVLMVVMAMSAPAVFADVKINTNKDSEIVNATETPSPTAPVDNETEENNEGGAEGNEDGSGDTETGTGSNEEGQETGGNEDGTGEGDENTEGGFSLGESLAGIPTYALCIAGLLLPLIVLIVAYVIFTRRNQSKSKSASSSSSQSSGSQNPNQQKKK